MLINQPTEYRLKRSALLALLVVSVFTQGCGNGHDSKQEETLAANQAGPPHTVYPDGDDPHAVLSDVMKKLKGRWVKEILDPNTANPPTMRLFATATNQLSGRFLVGGGFSDVGVAITITQDGDSFKLKLTDDEVRPHPWIPKSRIFKGTHDSEKKTIFFQATNGEYIKWELTENYTMYYTSNIYRCVLVAPPKPSAGASTPGRSETPSRPSSIPLPPPDDDYFNPWQPFAPESAPLTAVVRTPTPSPSPTPALAPPMFDACATMGTYHEEWSRMSGSATPQ